VSERADPAAPTGETPKARADRELIELLNEVRVALPGVTVLFGFLLAVPFARGWSRTSTFQRDVFVIAFLATAVSIGLLTAPSSYHRLRFRAADKEQLVKLGNALSIGGIFCLAIALTAVVLLVTDVLLSRTAAVASTASIATVLVLLWYGLPLAGRLRGRRGRS
jgi:hypothetical protein